MEGSGFSTEFHCGRTHVKDHLRLLYVHDLGYRGRTYEPAGSDRALDQKLTQIMIEIAEQNRDMYAIYSTANHDDFLMLASSGFRSMAGDRRSIEFNVEHMEKLQSFRADSKNKLFPPYKDYATHKMLFLMEDRANDNVYFQKEWRPQSWAKMIEQHPILHSDSGRLPEYWLRPPLVSDAMKQMALCWNHVNSLGISETLKKLFQEIVYVIENGSQGMESHMSPVLLEVFKGKEVVINDLQAKTYLELLCTARSFIDCFKDRAALYDSLLNVFVNKWLLAYGNYNLLFNAESLKIKFYQFLYPSVHRAIREQKWIIVSKPDSSLEWEWAAATDEHRKQVFQLFCIDPKNEQVPDKSVNQWKGFYDGVIKFFQNRALDLNPRATALLDMFYLLSREQAQMK